MYCNYCRANNPDDSTYCSNCGRTIARLSESDVHGSDAAHLQAEYQARTDEQLLHIAEKAHNLRPEVREVLHAEIQRRGIPLGARPDTEKKELRGVGGWLAFFVYLLIVGHPLLYLLNVGGEWSEPLLERAFVQFPRLKSALIIESVLELSIAAFSMYTGIQLRRVRPQAVALAKAYLGVCVLYSIVSFLLLYWVFPASVANEMAAESTRGLFSAIIFASIWFAYLAKSKRVASTYGRQAGG